MFETASYPQSVRLGHTLHNVDGIARLNQPGRPRFYAAVAYASVPGAALLDQTLSRECAGWSSWPKRWLVSIDFGRTDPASFDYLSRVALSEIRVPNGRAVVNSPSFSPVVAFHPKIFLTSSPGAVSAFVGSGNLTLSGLQAGDEAGILQRVRNPSQAHERAAYRQLRQMLAWADDLWDRADPLEDVIDEYRRLWRPPARHPIEPLQVRARALEHVPELLLSNARILWAETKNLNQNLGPGQPGNQLDLPRGSRVFFGFSPRTVAKNTVFGGVEFQYPLKVPTIKTVRYADNSMDKVNLPIPGTEGPAAYDDRIIAFERRGVSATGQRRFGVSLLTPQGLERLKRRAVAHRDFAMASGRQYGIVL